MQSSKKRLRQFEYFENRFNHNGAFFTRETFKHEEGKYMA